MQHQHQLQQLDTDIVQLREAHSCLQAYGLEQHQEELLAIEANTYTKLVQAGLLKHPLSPIMQKAFERTFS